MRNLYIRQDKGAADSGRDVPCQPQIRNAIGRHPAGSVKIPARPCGESQLRGCPTVHQMVVLKCEIKHSSGIFRGLGHIAPAQGLPASDKGDHTR